MATNVSAVSTTSATSTTSTTSAAVTGPRHDGRAPDELRPVRLTRGWLDHAEGSVLVEFGRTRVLCAASFTEGVPRWRKGSGAGWVTAEYAMLPRATNTRSDRESVKGRIGGRTHEISRLVGRSLRACIDTKALGENTVVLDCDVLQADGGTRTAAITGAYVALADAVSWARGRDCCKPGASRSPGPSPPCSVGVVDGRPVLDLDYTEDVSAEHRHERRDDGRRALRRGAGHGGARPFDRAELDVLLDLAVGGCAQLSRLQRRRWRSRPPEVRTVSRLVLATHNRHKVVELRRILADAGLDDIEVLGADDVPDLPDVAETGTTFAENALLKAHAVAAATGLPAVADDSGLVRRRARRDARGCSAHGGRGGTATTGRTSSCCWPRSATCPTTAGPDGSCAPPRWPCPTAGSDVAEGAWTARSYGRRAGSNGFGYDPMFVPEGETRTTSELTDDEKDAISHRGRALRALVPVVRDLLVGVTTS